MENSKQLSKETLLTKEEFINDWVAFFIKYNLIKITAEDEKEKEEKIKKIKDIFSEIFEKAKRKEIKPGYYREEAVKCCKKLSEIKGIELSEEIEKLEILKNHIENFISASIAYKIQE